MKNANSAQTCGICGCAFNFCVLQYVVNILMIAIGAVGSIDTL